MILLLVAHDRIGERRKNLFSGKHSKPGIVIHTYTPVHHVLFQMAHTVLLDARYASLMHPFTN